MGGSIGKSLTHTLSHRNYKKFREILYCVKEPHHGVKRWMLESQLSPHSIDSEVLNPMEYVAKGHVDDRSVIEVIMDHAVRSGAVECYVNSKSPNSIAEHLISPAIRREIAPVIKAVLTVKMKTPMLLTAHVPTKMSGTLVHSTLIHLAAEQGAVKSLKILIDAAKSSNIFDYVMARLDGAGQTALQVASQKTAVLLLPHEAIIVKQHSVGDMTSNTALKAVRRSIVDADEEIFLDFDDPPQPETESEPKQATTSAWSSPKKRTAPDNTL